MLTGGARVCFKAGPGVIAVAALLLGWQAPVRADHVEFFAGAWKYDIDGTFATGNTALAVNDLNVRSQGQLSLVFSYQPSGNWLPDVGASYDHIGASSKVTAGQTLKFGPLDLVQGQTQIDTRVHFDDYSISVDAPFYLFNIRTGVGLTLRRLVGSMKLNSTNQVVILSSIGVPLPTGAGTPQSAREDVNEFVPLPHLRFEGDLTSWLGFTVSGDYIAYRGEHLGQVRAVFDIRPFKWVALSAGYQGKVYKVNEDNYRLDVRLDGVVFGLTAIIP